MLPSGRPKFKSFDEVMAELRVFRSEASSDKAKAARVLGAISQSLWKNDHDHVEAEYNWLRSLVCYLASYALGCWC